MRYSRAHRWEGPAVPEDGPRHQRSWTCGRCGVEVRCPEGRSPGAYHGGDCMENCQRLVEEVLSS